ncbi:MAG: hypothetical protein AB1742_04660 [bacterium]
MRRPRFAVTLVSTALLCAHSFETLRVLFLPDGTPLFNDFALLQYTMSAARNFYAADGRLWGYDPHFMAGYPLTFIWNSNVALQAIAVIFRNVPSWLIARWFLFFALASTPVMLFLSFRNFGFAPRRALAGSALAILYVRLGAVSLFHLTGMTTAGLSTIFNLLALSLLFSFLTRRRSRTLLALLIAFPLAPFIHKTAPVVLLPPTAVLIALHLKTLKAKDWTALAALAALTAALNSFWALPILRFLHYKLLLTEAPFWQNYDLLRPLRDYFIPVMRINNLAFGGVHGALHTLLILAILVLGASGLIMRRKTDKNLSISLGAAALFLFILGYYGSFWSVTAQLNPTRYLVSLNLILIFPAAAALSTAAENLENRRILTHAASAALSITAMLALFAWSLHWLNPFYRLLGITPGGDTALLVSSLSSLPPGGGRILFEDSGVMDREGPGQQYDHIQLAAILPPRTGREFIGGPYPHVFLIHRFASFHDARLFGRDIDDFPPDDLRARLHLYDVRWIVAWSSKSRKYLDYFDRDFTRSTVVGRFAVYEFTGWNQGAFLKGAGVITADFNRISAQGVSPVNGEVIIGYHWMDGIASSPPLTVERAMILDDPVGFIKIKNPPPEFTLKF